MRITDMEVVPVRFRDSPVCNSSGVHGRTVDRTIVRLTAADGTVGVGETYGRVAGALERAVEHVEGMDAFDRHRLENRLGNAAYGAIETALVDLTGKVLGAPAAEVLGGRVREEVEFSAYLFYKHADPDPEDAPIAPYEVMSPEAMLEEAKEFVDQYGFRTLKLKGGVLDPAEEIRTLELFAEEFGPDTPLRIDPNAVWSVETATRISERLRELDLAIEWLEDPCRNLNAHARLKRNVVHPVATNMFVNDFDEVAPAVELNAVDVILSDHHYWGGLANTVHLDRVVDTLDLGVGMHSNSHLGVSMAAMTHVAAAMPVLGYACDTHYPWQVDDVIADAPIEISGGTIDVPDEPGLGVEIDERSLEELNERYERDDEPEYEEHTMAVDPRDPDRLRNPPLW